MASLQRVKKGTKIRMKLVNNQFQCMNLPCLFSTRKFDALIRHQNSGCKTNA